MTTNKQPDKKKISVANSLVDSKLKSRLVFSKVATKKMLYLLIGSSKEVGWHGFVNKLEKGVYYVTDIVIYPQETTSTSIHCDTTEYGLWQQNLCLKCPEEFEKLRLHGHSHVNMACFPSTTDKDLQDDGIEMLQENGFYIWLIANKNLNYWAKIADREDGVVYKEVSLIFEDEDWANLSIEYSANVDKEGYEDGHE